jgi:hypothetical protein
VTRHISNADNGGPPLDEGYVDRRHTLQIAIRESDLPPNAKYVGLLITTYMKADGGACWPGQRTLAEKSGLNRKTVAKVQNFLLDFEHISICKSKGSRGFSYSSNMSYETAISFYVSQQKQDAEPQTKTVSGPLRVGHKGTMSKLVDPSEGATNPKGVGQTDLVAPSNDLVAHLDPVCGPLRVGLKIEDKEEQEGGAASESPSISNIVLLHGSEPPAPKPTLAWSEQKQLDRLYSELGGEETGERHIRLYMRLMAFERDRALAELDEDIFAYGAGNVVEAMHKTRKSAKQANKLAGYYGTVVQSLAEKNGKVTFTAPKAAKTQEELIAEDAALSEKFRKLREESRWGKGA